MTYLAVRGASGALAMASLAWVVRGLGPERYGQLSLGLAASAAATLVLFSPIHATLARFHGEPVWRGRLLGLLRSILLGIGILLVATAWMAQASGWIVGSGGVLLAAAVLALAQGMFDLSCQHLAATEQRFRYALQYLGKSLLNLLLCVGAVHFGVGVSGVMLAMALAFAVAAMMEGQVWRPGPSGWTGGEGRGVETGHPEGSAPVRLCDTAELARFGGPLLVTSLLSYFLVWGDRYLLKQLVPLGELGRYVALSDLAVQTLGFLFMGLCTAWYPRLVVAWGGGDPLEAQRLYERYGALGLAVCLPAVVGFILLLPAAVPLCYGTSFLPLPAGLQPLIGLMAMVAAVKTFYLDVPLLLGKRVWWHASSLCLSAVTGMLLILLFVPRWGTSGAALGMLLGNLVGGGLSLWAGRGILRPRMPLALLWPPLVGSGVMALVLSAWDAGGLWGLVGSVAVGAAVYGTILWLMDYDGVRTRGLRRTPPSGESPRRVILFANTDWFLFNFKRSLAEALRTRGDEVILVSPPGEYGPRLQELGFRWEPLPMSRSGMNPFRELATILRILELYRDLRPTLVHHFTIKSVIYGSMAARVAGVRGVVNSVTGLGYGILARSTKARLVRPVVLALYRFALRGTHVIFQNSDNRDALAHYGVLAGSHVHVIQGDGIDTVRFSPSPDSELESASGKVPEPRNQDGPDAGSPPEQDIVPVVLMMARLLHSKGVGDFVTAAEMVRKTLPAVRFWLAGGPDPGNPECVSGSELASWQAKGDVTFLGHRSDVVPLNQRASIVVLASTQGEGIPRALLEGAACGAPMVATDVPGCRQVIVPGVTGCLVPPAQPKQLAAALLGLLADESMRRRMGGAAREHVVAHFSDEVINAQTFEVYEVALRREVSA